MPLRRLSALAGGLGLETLSFRRGFLWQWVGGSVIVFAYNSRRSIRPMARADPADSELGWLFSHFSSSTRCTMGRARSNRSGQGRRLRLVKGWRLALPSSHADAAWGAGCFRPRLEVLEDRLYPGDAVLGVWALTLAGQNHAASPANVLASTLQARDWGPGLDATRLAADSVSSLSVLDDSPNAGERQGSVTDDAASASTFGSAGVFDGPLFAEASLAPSAAALPMSAAAPVQGTGMPAEMGGAWSDASASFFALAVAGNGERAGGSAGLLAASRGSSAPLAFDASSGQLAIREDAGVHTASEAVTTDGFVDVTLDGQDHSNNPLSASFDRAPSRCYRQYRDRHSFAGGGQDTLILGSQQVAGGLTVQASGGTVVTQNVAATGRVGDPGAEYHGQRRFAGPQRVPGCFGLGHCECHGPHRERAAPSGRGIAVAADVFVNSGQLHADGPDRRSRSTCRPAIS